MSISLRGRTGLQSKVKTEGRVTLGFASLTKLEELAKT